MDNDGLKNQSLRGSVLSETRIRLQCLKGIMAKQNPSQLYTALTGSSGSSDSSVHVEAANPGKLMSPTWSSRNIIEHLP